MRLFNSSVNIVYYFSLSGLFNTSYIVNGTIGILSNLILLALNINPRLIYYLVLQSSRQLILSRFLLALNYGTSSLESSSNISTLGINYILVSWKGTLASLSTGIIIELLIVVSRVKLSSLINYIKTKLLLTVFLEKKF